MTISAPRSLTNSLVTKKYALANPYWSNLGSSTKRPLYLCNDRKTVIGYDATTQFLLYLCVNAESASPTWISMRKSFAGRLFSSVTEMGNGELLIANNALAASSQIYVTSGWPAAQAANYSNASLDAIVYTKVLDLIGGNTKMGYTAHVWATASDGTVLMSESGGQTTTARESSPNTQGATRVWISRNNGTTFTQIFDIYDYGLAAGAFPATTTNGTGLHIHGVSYDALWNRVAICWGDDTGQARNVAGTAYSEVTFLDFDGSNNLTATTKMSLDPHWSGLTSGQFILCIPTPFAYICSSDVSGPLAIQTFPRTGYRTLGTGRISNQQQYGGVDGTAGILRGSTGLPLFIPGQATKGSSENTNSMQWTIGVTDDGGITFSQIIGDIPAQTPAITGFGFGQVLGPLLGGKVLMLSSMYTNNDNTKTTMIADLVYPGA